MRGILFFVLGILAAHSLAELNVPKGQNVLATRQPPHILMYRPANPGENRHCDPFRSTLALLRSEIDLEKVGRARVSVTRPGPCIASYSVLLIASTCHSFLCGSRTWVI